MYSCAIDYRMGYNEMQGCTRMEVVANKYKVIAHCYCIMGGGGKFNCS